MLALVIASTAWQPGPVSYAAKPVNNNVQLASKTVFMAAEYAYDALTSDLESAVSKAKAFGLPPMARWRLDDAVKTAKRAKDTLSRSDQQVASAVNALRERDEALARAATAEEIAAAAAAKSDAIRFAKEELEGTLFEMYSQSEKAKVELEAATARAAEAESSGSKTEAALGAVRAELAEARAELEEGRLAAAELYGELNDQLELEQDSLTRSQRELFMKEEEVTAARKEAEQARAAEEAALARAATAEEEAHVMAAQSRELEQATHDAQRQAEAAVADAKRMACKLSTVTATADAAMQAADARVSAAQAQAMHATKAMSISVARAERQAVERVQQVKAEAASKVESADNRLASALSQLEIAIMERDWALWRANLVESLYAKATLSLRTRLVRLVSHLGRLVTWPLLAPLRILRARGGRAELAIRSPCTGVVVSTVRYSSPLRPITRAVAVPSDSRRMTAVL